MAQNWEIKNKVDDVAEILIYGDIVEEAWNEEDISAKLLNDELESLEGINELIIRVSSTGGDAFQGMAIFNSLKRFKNNNNVSVISYIDGIAASISSIIPLAADKIIMPENALYMIHLPFVTIAGGNSEDLRKKADVLDTITESLVDTYERKTGLSREQIKTFMKNEEWFKAERAKAFGFVDEIEEELEIAAKSDDLIVMNGVEVDLTEYKNLPESFLKDFQNDARSTPRDPEYDGVETKEWDSVDKDFNSFVEGYYRHNDVSKPDELPTNVNEATSDLKSWIAKKTLLGQTDVDTVEELIILPIVNPSTNNLNKDGVKAAKQFAPRVEDITQDTVEKVQKKCDRLLEEKFNNKRSDSMSFKKFETEEEYKNFIEEKRQGYFKKEDVLNELNEELEVDAEGIEEVVEAVSEIKNDLKEKEEKLQKIKKDKVFNQRKEKLSKYGVEVTKEEDYEDILNYSEGQFEKWLNSLEEVAKKAQENDSDEEDFYPNLMIDDEENDVDDDSIVNTFN
ncbi:MAG: head maturation protease, ClpP-related [Bacteroidales bacterium]